MHSVQTPVTDRFHHTAAENLPNITAKRKRTVNDIEFELRVENENLDDAVRNHAPNSKLMEIFYKIDKLVTERDVLNIQLEDHIRFPRNWGPTPNTWSWIRDGVCLAGVVVSVASLVGAVVSAKFVNFNCTQTDPIVTTNTVVCGFAVLYGVVSGIYWVVDNRKNESIAEQQSKLNESKYLNEFWRHLEEIKEVNATENKLLINIDFVEEKFSHCAHCLKEISRTADTPTVDRLGSMLIQSHPTDTTLKELFSKQQQIAEQIKEYIERESPMTKDIIVENADNSDSLNGPNSFLSSIEATKGPLNISGSIFQADKEEMLQTLHANFATINKKLGFNITTMYIAPDDAHTPIAVRDPSYYPDKQTTKDKEI